MLFSFTATAFAQDQIERMTADKMQSFRADEVNWQPEAILPKGAESVILLGDPTKAGVFIAWLKFPPNYPIPAHTHPYTEVITVLKGQLGNDFSIWMRMCRDWIIRWEFQPGNKHTRFGRIAQQYHT